jgi:hypothetical protein
LRQAILLAQADRRLDRQLPLTGIEQIDLLDVQNYEGAFNIMQRFFTSLPRFSNLCRINFSGIIFGRERLDVLTKSSSQLPSCFISFTDCLFKSPGTINLMTLRVSSVLIRFPFSNPRGHGLTLSTALLASMIDPEIITSVDLQGSPVASAAAFMAKAGWRNLLPLLQELSLPSPDVLWNNLIHGPLPGFRGLLRLRIERSAARQYSSSELSSLPTMFPMLEEYHGPMALAHVFAMKGPLRVVSGFTSNNKHTPTACDKFLGSLRALHDERPQLRKLSLHQLPLVSHSILEAAGSFKELRSLNIDIRCFTPRVPESLWTSISVKHGPSAAFSRIPLIASVGGSCYAGHQ